MANQQNSYTVSDGSGTNNRDFSYTFPSFLESEVKVEIDNVVKTLTTHYTIVNHNNTSGGTVRFNATGLPDGTAGTTPVRIFRQTDVEAAKAEFTAGSSLKAQEINDNFKQLRHALQEAIGANATDRKVQPFNIEDGAITSAAIKDLTIARGDIANDAVDGTKIADDAVDSEHIAADSIDAEHYAPGSVDTTALGADSVTSAKIGDDQINSEHYVGLSIDTEHIANENVTTAKLAPDAVTSAKLADNAVNSEHYVDGSIDHVHLANDIIDGDNIQDDVINSEHYVAGSIDHEHLAGDVVDGDNIADNSINSEHYVDGSIDREHLAADIVDGTKIADDSIDSEHIAAGALDNEHYAAGSITSDKLNGATVITAAEQGSATANDTSFLTSAAADARFFNVSTGDTIKDGDTFPDNDTTIATTAAINDRIIDLVDDVGGFVPIANETSFPTTNPDINTSGSAKGGTIVSVKTASTNLVPSGTTVTIANGRGSGLAVIITGVPSTIPSGFGFLVETTATDHTYAFHRLVPKATEVTTVAGISSNVTTVATNIADINTVAADLNEGTSEIDTVATNIANVNTVGNAIANVNTTAGSIANVNTTAGSITNVNNVGNNISNVNSVASNASNINSAVSNASNINSAVSNASNINTVAGSISNVNTTAGSISNVNTVASNISSVNNFADQYRIGSTNPTTSLDTGDLFFNTSTSSLKVYTGSAWVDGVTTTGDFALKTGNTFTGSNIHNDNVKSIYGTSSDGLEIFHNGNDSLIKDTGTGGLTISTNQLLVRNAAVNEFLIQAVENAGVKLYHDNSKKLETTSTGATVTGNLDVSSGVDVTGNITVSGNVDGRDVAADGTKLDGIESNATADQTASDIKTLLQSSKLTVDEIANNAITTAKINADAVDGTKIADDSINSEHYVNGSIDTAHIANQQITSDKLADDSVLTAKIQNGNVTEAKLATGSVTNAKIGTGAVATAAIADDAVTNAKIGSGAVDNTKIASSTIQAANIAPNAIIEAKIADGAVAADKLTSNAVSTIKIQDDAVTSAKIADATITNSNIAADTIQFTKIQEMATNHLLGRNTSGTGNPEILGVGQVRTMLNVEDGATADQTASEILTLIKTVDGAGSGLDADTVDGISSASFLRSDTSDNFSSLTCSTTGVDDLINFTGADGSEGRGIAFNNKTALSASATDTYLRLNNASEFSNGVYTPLVMRADGGFNVDGTTVINGSAQLISSRLTGALPAIDGSNLTGISAGATGASNDEIFWENGTNVTADYTITNGKNAMSAGPIQINSGVTVTIGSGETWTVV